MVSSFEQNIYNTFLKVSRSSKNKPYRFKKDFTNIEPETEMFLKKLSLFFKKHSEIKLEDFFKAPYSVYPDEQHFDLAYYSSLKAIKAYTTLQKQKEFLDPDNDDQIELTKQSIKFISSFCKENNILCKNYLEHKTNNLYSFILHLKERKINIYSVIAFKNFEKLLKSVDYDVLRFMFNEDFLNNISTFKIKFLNSERCKLLINKSLKFFDIFS